MVRSFHARNTLFLMLALGAVTSAGCGPTWRVVRDGGSPSPLRGPPPITVSFDYSQLVIGGKNERDFVQAKMAEDAAYGQTWTELKAAFESHVLTGMANEYPAGVQAGPPAPAGVHLFVVPTAMSMGKYMVVTSTATRIDANLAFTVNGLPADVISVGAERFATITMPSVFQHVPAIGTYIGRAGNRYVMSKN